jgi:hypothetical protein
MRHQRRQCQRASEFDIDRAVEPKRFGSSDSKGLGRTKRDSRDRPDGHGRGNQCSGRYIERRYWRKCRARDGAGISGSWSSGQLRTAVQVRNLNHWSDHDHWRYRSEPNRR